MAISVVIADDQEMVRTGFRMILESQPDIEVLADVADVADGEAALAAVAGHHPDVLLLDIRGLTERFSRTGPPVTLSIENGLEDRLPAHVAATAHRIVLEALTNTGKHAATATAVRVSLRTVPTGLEVRIADDGGRPARLSEKARGGGYGLAGMAERAQALGGLLTAGPGPEGGWIVTAVLPL
ncbi:ATP-binding protein [Streptomyces sp. NPDC090021]|uniref:ATP-binding protein n=1 Tax=Streptomyces sp. NPDC090021 TaxID=3365919 RepID=UPI00381266B1